MIDLFSDSGLAQLEELSRARALFAFDFDGTLAEIVRERDRAQVRPAVLQALRELGKLAPTAVVSGRSLEDLQPRIGGAVPYLIGNHGLEGLQEEAEIRDQARALCRSWLQQLHGTAAARLRDEGITVEDKTYSLTLHYRGSRNTANARRIGMETLSRLTPAPRIILGKSVVNAVPAGAPHKGEAILTLMRRLNATTAFYVGDDETDEDVFALPDDRIVTVRIGKKRGSRARFFLKDQDEVAPLLGELVNLLSRRRPAYASG